MIPLEQCAAILNKGKEKYDNEKVKIVRQYLYLLAELQIENEKIALTKNIRSQLRHTRRTLTEVL